MPIKLRRVNERLLRLDVSGSTVAVVRNGVCVKSIWLNKPDGVPYQARGGGDLPDEYAGKTEAELVALGFVFRGVRSFFEDEAGRRFNHLESHEYLADDLEGPVYPASDVEIVE